MKKSFIKRHFILLTISLLIPWICGVFIWTDYLINNYAYVEVEIFSPEGVMIGLTPWIFVIISPIWMLLIISDIDRSIYNKRNSFKQDEDLNDPHMEVAD